MVFRLKFKVGGQPVKNFRMVERHYFQDRLLKTYDFTFPFCMPNSVNEWEAVYDMPFTSNEQSTSIVWGIRV